jgi:hypothetical protein
LLEELPGGVGEATPVQRSKSNSTGVRLPMTSPVFSSLSALTT